MKANVKADDEARETGKCLTNNLLGMGAAFAAALVVGIASLSVYGINERGLIGALSATARLHFLLFWVAYSGSALAALFGSTFQPLKRHARGFGLAFASALLVHLWFVCFLCAIGDAPSQSTFVFFGTAAAFAYLLAVFSIPRLHRLLSSRAWWFLSNIGLNYIAYAYLVDFAKGPLDGVWRHIISYSPFLALAIVGPILRALAFAKRIEQSRQRSAAPR
jgi:hypothetical protein